MRSAVTPIPRKEHNRDGNRSLLLGMLNLHGFQSTVAHERFLGRRERPINNSQVDSVEEVPSARRDSLLCRLSRRCFMPLFFFMEF